MTRPNPRQQQAALSAAFAGAFDLSALKNRSAPGAPAGAAGTPPATDSPYVLNVTEATFGQVVQTSTDILVVVELWSPRAPHAAALSATLASLAGKSGGAWVLARVDVDANPRVAQAFGVQAIPTVVAVAAGQPVDAFEDVQPEAQVKAWIDALLTALKDRLPGIAAALAQLPVDETEEAEPEDPRVVAAEDLLNEGDFDGARAAYQAILDADPRHPEAAAAIVQVDFLARVSGHPENAVPLADANPDDVDAQKAAADVELAGGNPEAAFARLIRTVGTTAGDDRIAARDHLISLFALFPSDDGQVRAARRKLAAVLY